MICYRFLIAVLTATIASASPSSPEWLGVSGSPGETPMEASPFGNPVPQSFPEKASDLQGSNQQPEFAGNFGNPEQVPWSPHKASELEGSNQHPGFMGNFENPEQVPWSSPHKTSELEGSNQQPEFMGNFANPEHVPRSSLDLNQHPKFTRDSGNYGSVSPLDRDWQLKGLDRHPKFTSDSGKYEPVPRSSLDRESELQSSNRHPEFMGDFERPLPSEEKQKFEHPQRKTGHQSFGEPQILQQPGTYGVPLRFERLETPELSQNFPQSKAYKRPQIHGKPPGYEVPESQYQPSFSQKPSTFFPKFSAEPSPIAPNPAKNVFIPDSDIVGRKSSGDGNSRGPFIPIDSPVVPDILVPEDAAVGGEPRYVHELRQPVIPKDHPDLLQKISIPEDSFARRELSGGINRGRYAPKHHPLGVHRDMPSFDLPDTLISPFLPLGDFSGTTENGREQKKLRGVPSVPQMFYPNAGGDDSMGLGVDIGNQAGSVGRRNTYGDRKPHKRSHQYPFLQFPNLLDIDEGDDSIGLGIAVNSGTSEEGNVVGSKQDGRSRNEHGGRKRKGSDYQGGDEGLDSSGGGRGDGDGSDLQRESSPRGPDSTSTNQAPRRHCLKRRPCSKKCRCHRRCCCRCCCKSSRCCRKPHDPNSSCRKKRCCCCCCRPCRGRKCRNTE